MRKSILFFGDSNTWGYNPVDGSRYPYEQRWTSICAEKLGDNYDCIPSGMNGRATVFADELGIFPSGISNIWIEIKTHRPLDLLVIALGTNDLMYTDAEGSAAGLRKLLDCIKMVNEKLPSEFPAFNKDAKIMIISPIHVAADFKVETKWDKVEESQKFACLFKQIALDYSCEFMDAALYGWPSDADGVHMDPEAHMALGKAVAKKILKDIYG